MATPQPRKSARRTSGAKEFTFIWEAKDRKGKIVRGEMRAASETAVIVLLRRQALLPVRVKKQKLRGGHGRVTEKDVALFTRQMATMMRSGIPLLQAFDIVAKGAASLATTKLLLDLKAEVEAGSSLNQAFRKHPRYFDALYCNLVQAGEQAGILDSLLERLATYKEKILAIKSKIKTAMFYPTAVIVVAIGVTAILMMFVVPKFKEVFRGFGADLPGPTLVVIAISDFFVAHAFVIAVVLIAGTLAFFYTWKRSVPMQIALDRLFLRLPIFGPVLRKSTLARWTRTLSTMFAAGVPLVEALGSVGPASGNHVYKVATEGIQNQVNTGTSLTVAMQNSGVFPNMVIQMVSIGEESGQLDAMLGKIADFYEGEVDDAVARLSSLMEPIILVILGVLVGGMVIAMYLPIFNLGSVV
jgi:type IV pilus assembly protein PilC